MTASGLGKVKNERSGPGSLAKGLRPGARRQKFLNYLGAAQTGS